jgi:hypothetical protein
MSNDPTAPVPEPEPEPEPSPNGEEPAEEQAAPPPSAPNPVSHLESQLAQQGNMIATLQGTISQLLGATAQAAQGMAEEPDDTDQSIEARQQALWTDPDAYLAERAVKPAVEEVKKQILPYLQMQARDRRTELMDEVREQFDGQFGAGSFEETVAGDVNRAIDRIPLALQSSRDHVRAAAAGVLGHYYLTNRGDALDKKRAARREAPRLLDQTRARPRGETLTADEKAFVTSVQRTDPSYNEGKYLKAKARIATRRGAMG